MRQRDHTPVNQAVQDALEAIALPGAWEAAAVGLALAYLVLAIRQNPWCWPAALLSALIYLFLMAEAKLYMQSALQLFYAVMAIYGWWHWRRGDHGQAPPVRSWTRRQHVPALALIVVPGLILGALLAVYSDAAFPYLDALVACGAVVATWMVARKILQNWHYWFVIDVVSGVIYARQGLWLTAALFGLYLVLVVIGLRRWRASFEAADRPREAPAHG